MQSAFAPHFHLTGEGFGLACLIVLEEMHEPCILYILHTSWPRFRNGLETTDTNNQQQLTFYWILETSRRRCINLTLLVCTAGLAIGSEVVQALLPNGRSFDPFDIVGNVFGSALALLISSWYHKRMLERRRKSKHYDIVPGEEPADDDDEERDVELGTVRDQETGVVPVAANGSPVQAGAGAKKTDVSEELDNWDENAEDWDEEPAADGTKSAPDEVDSKKRVD